MFTSSFVYMFDYLLGFVCFFARLFRCLRVWLFVSVSVCAFGCLCVWLFVWSDG